MKAVILAGGLGTRLGEETIVRPKPLVEIGGYPIIWHIMKHYSKHNINDFIILLGYKGFMIKEFFYHYQNYTSDMFLDMEKREHKYIKKEDKTPKWKINFVYTGELSMTGARVKKAEGFFKDGEDFCLTYGDGVSDIDITKEIEYHKKNKKIATVTAVMPPARFGLLKIEDDNRVSEFIEKPKNDNSYISGGFFVFNKKIFDYINSDENTVLEKEPLHNIAKDKELIAYKHNGFWQCMDTQRDKALLEEMWQKGEAPWKTWN